MKLYAVHEEAGERKFLAEVRGLEQAAELVETLCEEDRWPEGCEAYVADEAAVEWYLEEDGMTWRRLP